MDVPSIMDYGLDLTASRDHVMEDRNGLLEAIATASIYGWIAWNADLMSM